MPETSSNVASHPYVHLEERSIWREAVARTHPLQLKDIYRKKFSIDPEHKISTAGSCFAQHISRHLTKAGFNFQDFEPAPPLLPQHLRQKFNYGTYSARYCNIYTARQLHQLVDRALGHFSPVEQPWRMADGVVDPFRPLLEPVPFADVTELERSRADHMAAVREMLHKSDIIIFTLGLTEGWISKADGAVRPLCPGTAGGSFSEMAYEFKNFNYFEIFEDLVGAFSKIKSLNPSIRFVLTVSPVPLTATKTEDHVMVATSYSKAVLRAVAGHVASEVDFVEYFPSYELIAAPSMKGLFFDHNMRTVNEAGVSYVMTHFFDQHLPKQAATTTKVDHDPKALAGDLEVACEEMMQAQALGYA